MRENLIESKSMAFAIQIVRLYQDLTAEQREYVLSKQLLRSGTSIGANIREAVQGFSRKDFVYKMNIALKECSETLYWLELLHETDYLSDKAYQRISSEAMDLLKLLTSIVKTAKQTLS